MRGRAASEPMYSEPRGLTKSVSSNSISTTMASRAMRLKLSGKLSGKDWEISERRQVGDTEAMVNKGSGAWWRHVGMEEGL